MPRALARSAYGTSRRIGEAGVSIARLESLTLLNAAPVTFDTQRANANPSIARLNVHRIYQSFPFAQALKQRRRSRHDKQSQSRSLARTRRYPSFQDCKPRVERPT